MIYGIGAAFIISAFFLIIVQRFKIPEIPTYLFAGLVTGLFLELLERRDFIGSDILDEALLQDFIFIGLGFLVFFSITRFVLDKNTTTSLDAFKASMWLSIISFIGVFGLASFAGFEPVESFLLGFAGAFGSSLANMNLVREEVRENHIYGWLTEDINFFQDIFAVLLGVGFLVFYSSSGSFEQAFLVLLMIISALGLRKILHRIFVSMDFSSEVLMLLGVASFVSITLLTELLGLTALAGVLISGLLFIDTELGFEVRERLSSIKDFFTALSFFSIGLIIQIPTFSVVLPALALVLFVSVLRPLVLLLFLNVQGYDLRTSYLAALDSNEISELSILTTILLLPLISSEVFAIVILGFAVSMVVSSLTGDIGMKVFEKWMAGYEFDPEKGSVTREISNHVIFAGYDDKTRALSDLVNKDRIVAVDYSLDRIETAERDGVYHVLGDMFSTNTWRHINYRDAAVIVSGVSDQELINKIEALDTGASIVSLDSSNSGEIDDELRSMLKDALKEKEEN